MDENRLMSLLSKLEIPVTNTEFPPNIEVKPPFLVFLSPKIETFKADNYVYSYSKKFLVEIYTKFKRDNELESKLIKLLNEEKIAWEFVSTSKIEGGIYVTVYDL